MAELKASELEWEVDGLHANAVDLTIEVERAGDEVRGQGIEVGLRVFRQLMLQLNLDFDMRALEVLITPEVVDEAVDRVEEEVAVARRTTLGVVGTSWGGAIAEIGHWLES